MKSFTQTEIFREACRALNKFGLYISFEFTTNLDSDLFLAAPYLNFQEHSQIIIDGVGYLLFDTREEMESHYRQTVGDDGPTETNPYDGPVRVYALTCNNEGQLET